MSQNLVSQFIEQAIEETRLGKFKDGLASVRRALALDPANGEALGLKGVICSMLGMPADAEASFKEAEKVMPGDPKIAFNYASFLEEAGRHQDALEYARIAALANPRNRSAVDLLRNLETATGAVPAEIQEFEDSHDAIPTPVTPNADPMGESPYLRVGFYAEDMNVQSLQFVESLGELWYACGWLLVAGGALAFVPVTFHAIRMFLANTLSIQPTHPVTGSSGFELPLGLQMAVLLAIVVWTTLEMINRRGNWFWLVTILLSDVLTCFFLNLSWLVLMIYLIFDRPKERAAT